MTGLQRFDYIFLYFLLLLFPGKTSFSWECRFLMGIRFWMQIFMGMQILNEQFVTAFHHIIVILSVCYTICNRFVLINVKGCQKGPSCSLFWFISPYTHIGLSRQKIHTWWGNSTVTTLSWTNLQLKPKKPHCHLLEDSGEASKLSGKHFEWSLTSLYNRIWCITYSNPRYHVGDNNTPYVLIRFYYSWHYI